MQVTITVPSDEEVIVSAQHSLRLEHTAGQEDLFIAIVTQVPGCSLDLIWTATVVVAADAANGSYFQTLSYRTIFAVTAGTFTFHASGFMQHGPSSLDAVFYGSLVAVFYPS